MATPQLITRDNYIPLLQRSTNPRGSVPDGNIYIGASIDQLQIIDATELAQINFGSGDEANPLTNEFKVQALAIYFFLLTEVENDPALQNFRFSMDAVVNRMAKLVGATGFLNGVKLASGAIDIADVGGSLGDDRLKIADSGFTEFADGSGGNTLIDRVYHGAKSLNDINSTTQPFYQLVLKPVTEATRQSAIPVDFSKLGGINEVIQSYGSSSNGDGGTSDFDYRNYELILGAREFGYTMGEAGSSATGVPELGAYSAGYGIGNSPVSDILALDLADVFGGGQVAPYTGMGFWRDASGQSESGFVEADGDFTDRITNTGGGSLIQLRAFMDAIMNDDSDNNDNTGSTGSFIPKRAEPLYTIDASTGKMVTRQGLFIDNISAQDEQSVIFTDDTGNQKTRPIVTAVVIFLSESWWADTAGWFRLMYYDGSGVDDFDTALAVTVQDGSLTDVAGDKGDARIFAVTDGYELRFSYSYDTNTQAGLSGGADKDVILQVGGTDATKSKTFPFTISDVALNQDGSTDAETN